MSGVQIAFYRGPPRRWLHKLSHWLICLFTLSRYSHCELVIDGVCWSSSARDGGVRAGVQSLETAGLLAAGRALQILDDEIQQLERYTG